MSHLENEASRRIQRLEEDLRLSEHIKDEWVKRCREQEKIAHEWELWAAFWCLATIGSVGLDFILMWLRHR